MALGPVQLLVIGFGISDGFISPLDLVEIGLLARDEVEAHALEQTA